MNLYQKHKDCLFRKAPMFLKHCHEQLAKEISEIPNYQEYIYHKVVSKMTCKGRRKGINKQCPLR
ncbi:UNVERIFIED_CONTAM: hypothetical protein NCL1_51510 [Trichonephila clavipes]